MSIQEIVKMIVEELKIDQEKYLELLGNEDYAEIENELCKWLAAEYKDLGGGIAFWYMHQTNGAMKAILVDVHYIKLFIFCLIQNIARKIM